MFYFGYLIICWSPYLLHYVWRYILRLCFSFIILIRIDVISRIIDPKLDPIMLLHFLLLYFICIMMHWLSCWTMYLWRFELYSFITSHDYMIIISWYLNLQLSFYWFYFIDPIWALDPCTFITSHPMIMRVCFGIIFGNLSYAYLWTLSWHLLIWVLVLVRLKIPKSN